MKEETARAVANVVIGAVAIGAAVIILRTPRLRRLAWGLGRAAITTGIPAWMAGELRNAWEASRPQNAGFASREVPTPDSALPQGRTAAL
jgi:hypothetical protein